MYFRFFDPGLGTLCLNNLALVYRSMRRYQEAEPLSKMALESVTNALGEHHPNTLMFWKNYESLLAKKEGKTQ